MGEYHLLLRGRTYTLTTGWWSFRDTVVVLSFSFGWQIYKDLPSAYERAPATQRWGEGPASIIPGSPRLHEASPKLTASTVTLSCKKPICSLNFPTGISDWLLIVILGNVGMSHQCYSISSLLSCPGVSVVFGLAYTGWDKSRFTAVSTGNTEFIFVLSFINSYTIFQNNNCKLTSVPPCIVDGPRKIFLRPRKSHEIK